jgi:hypothetical protein
MGLRQHEAAPLKLTHLPGGRSVADTAVMVALTTRSAAAVRKHCERGELGYDVQACEQALSGADDPVLLTARQAQQYLGIPSGTVYSWASRGGVRSLDHDQMGRPLYDVGDLLRLRQTGDET